MSQARSPIIKPLKGTLLIQTDYWSEARMTAFCLEGSQCRENQNSGETTESKVLLLGMKPQRSGKLKRFLINIAPFIVIAVVREVLKLTNLLNEANSYSFWGFYSWEWAIFIVFAVIEMIQVYRSLDKRS